MFHHTSALLQNHFWNIFYFFTKSENGINLIDEWLQFNMNECKQRKWCFKLNVYKQKFFDHLYNLVKDFKICVGDWSSSKTLNAKGQRGPNRNIFKFYTNKKRNEFSLKYL